MENKNEIWKDIEGYEGLYKISDLGRVISIRYKKDKILKQNYCGLYFSIGLSKNRKTERITIHRLIAIHFIYNNEGKTQVNHINGIKTDNRIQNLEWVTPKENIRHAFATKLKIPVKGEENGGSKLTNKCILDIRASELSQVELAKIYNVLQSNIHCIIKRKTWKHI